MNDSRVRAAKNGDGHWVYSVADLRSRLGPFGSVRQTAGWAGVEAILDAARTDMRMRDLMYNVLVPAGQEKISPQSMIFFLGLLRALRDARREYFSLAGSAAGGE